MLNCLATRLLSKIGIFDDILKITSLSGGRQHQTYKVELADKQKIVIKILNFKCYFGTYSIEHFNLTETFATYVNKHLTFSLAAFKIKDRYTVTEQDLSYLIFPWCEGTSTHNINTKHCQTIAKLLCDIHSLKPLKLALNPIPLVPFQNKNWQSLLNKYVSRAELANLIHLADNCQKQRMLYKGKRVLTHRDINLDNILWRSEQHAILIDWESAGYIAPEVELLAVATNMAGIASSKLDLKLVKSTIESYKSTKGCNELKITDELYLQSYATWFHWLDYCLSKNSLSLLEKDKEIHITLNAIKLLEKYKNIIINYF